MTELLLLEDMLARSNIERRFIYICIRNGISLVTENDSELTYSV